MEVDNTITPPLIHNIKTKNPTNIAAHIKDNAEDLYKELGLRHLGKLQTPTDATCYGYCILITVLLLGLAYIYAGFISKLLPYSGYEVLDAVKEDVYFCYLAPLILLPTL
eukprot:gene63185-86432_t